MAAKTGEQIGAPITKNGDIFISSKAFSPDSTRILIIHKGIHITDVKTGEQIGATIAYNGKYEFSPDGTRIVTANDNGAMRIWDAETGQQVGPQLQNENGVYNQATFSSDGTQIVSVAGDRTARIWDVKSKQRIGADIAETLTAYCSGVRFDSDIGILQAVSQEEREQLSKKLASALGESADWRFVIGKNLPQDPKTALFSPRMTATVRDIATRLIASCWICEASANDCAHPLLPFVHATVASSEVDSQRYKQQDMGALSLLPMDVSAADLRLVARIIVRRGACNQKKMALALLNRAREKIAEDDKTKEFRAKLEDPNHRFTEDL
jgi:hypothetical protein